MAKAIARKTKLADGEHSIERANVRVRGEEKVLDWRIRLHGESEPRIKRTQGRKDETDGEIRRRAKETAAELLRTDGVKSLWGPNSSLSAFIEAVVKPDIEKAPLVKNSRTRYSISLRQLLGECLEHEHKFSLKRRTISAGTRYIAMENCLLEIAELHGAESARQARSVLSGYVLKSLQRNHLVVGNILRGERIDLKSNAKVRESGKQGGVALTRDQYNSVIEYLLAIDPADGVEKPKRGRWTLEDAIAKRRNAIDITLLQAGTGLRISEARQAWCGLFIDTGAGLHIKVATEITKGGYERVAHVLDPRVAERLRDRLTRAKNDSELIVGSPFDASKVWDLRNCSKVLEALYLEMAETLKIEAFKAERSHVWRATLNTLLVGVVPDAMRAAQFGHTEEVNMKSYTDKALTPEMVAASSQTLAP